VLWRHLASYNETNIYIARRLHTADADETRLRLWCELRTVSAETPSTIFKFHNDITDYVIEYRTQVMPKTEICNNSLDFSQQK